MRPGEDDFVVAAEPSGANDQTSEARSQRARPRKHSFSIAGHRTSISLEAEFWSALREIAAAERRSLASLVADIDKGRGDSGLSGAIRVYVLEHYQKQARAAGA